MEHRTSATLFSGFEGVGIGSKAAGLTHLWGVEYDAAIASVAETNGFRTIVADVCDVDYENLPRPWHLHASPVCKNASVAKAGGEESDIDLVTAGAVCRAIVALKPTLFTLENVRGYLHFAAFKNIVATLKRLGYTVTHGVLNSANFGVAQTRERLILVARNDGRKPKLPAHTHARADKLGTLFDDRKPWVGWYEAIEDLIPTLPNAVFAPWQLARLPDELRETCVVTGLRHTARPATMLDTAEPYPTVTTLEFHQPSTTPRAFIVNTNQSGNDGDMIQVRAEDEPMFTTTISAEGRLKAFVVNNQTGSGDDAVQVRNQDEPMFTATISTAGRAKAFIVDGQPAYGSDDTATRADGEPVFTIGATQDRRPLRAFVVNESSSMEIRRDDEPMTTQVASPSRGLKAFVVDCKNSRNDGIGPDSRPDAEPMFTTTSAMATHMPKMGVNGRVVKMMPRCLARFQSFPDSYVLPNSAKLATTGIGNAVPPLLMQRVLEANL